MTCQVITLQDAINAMIENNDYTFEEIKKMYGNFTLTRKSNFYDYLMYNIDNLYHITPTLTRKEFNKIISQLSKGDIYFFVLDNNHHVIFYNNTTKRSYII